jgi:hypothetical protein
MRKRKVSKGIRWEVLKVGLPIWNSPKKRKYSYYKKVTVFEHIIKV